MKDRLSSKGRWIVFALLLFTLILMLSGNSSSSQEKSTSSPENFSTDKIQQEINIVRLNIGGKRFYTTDETLTQFAENDQSFFKVILRRKGPRDEQGFIFIDRNGELFEPILEYLRTGIWECPPHIKLERLLQEADFYGIQPPLGLVLAELVKNVEKEENEEILAPYKTEIEELKQFIFQSFTSAAKSKNKTKDGWNAWTPETAWVFPSEDAMKVLTEASSSEDERVAAKAYYAGAYKVWYNEPCFRALEKQNFVESFVKHLYTKYQVSVAFERKFVVQRPKWQRRGERGDVYITSENPIPPAGGSPDLLFPIVRFLTRITAI